MSVDERLRQGLARNAGAVEASTERHLSTVLARARRRRRCRWSWAAAGAAASAAVLLLPSVFGVSRTDNPATVARATGSSSTSAGATGGAFPEGTYVASATLATARAAGFTNRQIRSAYGPDGSLGITIKFVGGHWTQLADYTPGVPEPGDAGTSRVTGNTLVTTSSSQGCPDCVGELFWSFNGRRLTLQYTQPMEHTALQRLMTEHTYLKIG